MPVSLKGLRVRRTAARWSVAVGAATALATGLAAPAAAVGVTPAIVEKSIDAGTSFTVDKVVSTPAIPPKPDVVLLVDTTGSMGGAIANVQTNLQQVINQVRAVQSGAQFAVASYRDAGDGAELFRVRQNLTDNDAAVQAAVDDLAVGGGGDFPEAWINALHRVSDGDIAYRAGSSPIVVLVGDAPSNVLPGGHTLAQAAAALEADGARVVAVNVGVSGAGLNQFNQVTDLLAVTGGKLVESAAGGVTDAILEGLHDLDVTVKPVASCDAGVTVSFDAASKVVRSGTNANFTETVELAAGATEGATLECTVDFKINDELTDAAFTQKVTVHVNDKTPPVVVVGDETVEATSPAGAVVNYTATATDNVDGPLTPSCLPLTGGTFPLGATTVTCTAKDAAGNVGTDTAVMRVVDTTPPVSACTPSVNPAGKVPSSANPDGFYQLSATDIVDTAVQVYVRDTAGGSVNFGPYPSGTKIKLVQAPGAVPTVKPGTGDVDYKITLRGDARIVGVDDAGNISAAVTCLVPPAK